MKKYRIAVLIAVITVLAFAGSLGNKFVYDDRYFIVENTAIRNLGNAALFFTSMESFAAPGNFYIYRPLATLSYAIDYRLSGLNPAMFHLSSVLWHAAVCAMLYFTLSLILKDKSVSLFSALLFAVHPVQAETVAWVSQRSNLISLFFFLLALYLWIKNSSVPSVICYALALLGKEMAITLPFLLVLYDFYFDCGVKKKTKQYAPFFMTAILYVILRTFVLGRISGQDAWTGGSICTALLTSVKIVPFYVRLLMFPFGLCIEHDFAPAKSLLEPASLFSLVFVVALVSVAVSLTGKRKKEGFFLLWFLVTLLPVSNIIPLEKVIVAERFLYFPATGFCVPVSMALINMAGKSKTARRTALVLMALVLVIYTHLLVNRNHAWKDELTLWNVTTRDNPASYLARYNLGWLYGQSGRHREAAASFERAIALDNTHAEAYHNLGWAYGRLGRYDEEIRSYTEAIRLQPSDAMAYCNLAMAYLRKGDRKEALRQYEILKSMNAYLAEELMALMRSDEKKQ